jgi:hypothetical protein
LEKYLSSNAQMRFRKLRIAWSVAWGLLAVLLVVLWVRSYWHQDELVGSIGTTGLMNISSANVAKHRLHLVFERPGLLAREIVAFQK